jgi:hypothetical protein
MRPIATQGNQSPAIDYRRFGTLVIHLGRCIERNGYGTGATAKGDNATFPNGINEGLRLAGFSRARTNHGRRDRNVVRKRSGRNVDAVFGAG